MSSWNLEVRVSSRAESSLQDFFFKYLTLQPVADMGCSQKRCTRGGDRVRGCITHLLSIKNSNVDGFHVSLVINI